jgi:hypothetical protein
MYFFLSGGLLQPQTIYFIFVLFGLALNSPDEDAKSTFD